MTRLTPIQETLLRAAAEGEGAFAASRTWKTVAALVGKGLLTSTPIAEGGAHTAITDAGRVAIGLELTGMTAHASFNRQPFKALNEAPRPDVRTSAAEMPAGPKGKIGVLVAMLRDTNGATMDGMTKATGWQAHSVRGAISGSVKKTLGLLVASEKTDGVRVYRIVEAVA